MKIRVKRHSVIQPRDKSIKLIPLTNGQNAIVDAADFNWLDQWNWYAKWTPDTHSFRAFRNVTVGGKQESLAMHQAITGFAQTDHRNHNTLDNRRENLREVDHSRNLANGKKRRHNTSGFKGVMWSKSMGKWRARIGVNLKRLHVGYFTNLEEAARAYDAAAREHFGEFAHTNFSE